MKEWSGGSHIFTKSTPRVPGNIPLTAIWYKYIYHKVLGFISGEGTEITEPGVTYLYHYPDNYNIVSIWPVLYHHVIDSYFSDCYAINNHNRMRQFELVLYKYWVTQSGYFRLVTTVALGMGLTDGNLLFCHGISEKSKDKTISMREYTDRTVYDWFNNPFSGDHGSPNLNIPHITIDDSH